LIKAKPLSENKKPPAETQRAFVVEEELPVTPLSVHRYFVSMS